MADNKKWFKVWTQILTDPSFDDIHNQAIGAWVRLGALVAFHGDAGQIEISKKQLLKRLHLSNETKQEALQLILNDLEKINVKVTENGNGICFVSFKNWKKYQADWNSYERLKKWRETQRETVQNKKKKENRSRIEVDKEVDKEVEKKKKSMSDEDFISSLKINTAYEGINIDKELAKMDAWFSTPRGQGRQKTRRFIISWLNKIDKPMSINPQPSRHSAVALAKIADLRHQKEKEASNDTKE